MSFTGNFLATSFKKELLQGLHNFSSVGGDTFKLALYDDTAAMDADTEDYVSTHEFVGTGYSAGGNALSIPTLITYPFADGTTVFCDFDDEAWPGSTIIARGAMLYNFTAGTNTVAILDFGSNQSSSAGTFTVVFPPATSAAAIIRIA